MIKELMHDPIFLAGKSEVATKEDLQVAQDLLDTLMAHKDNCVGMATNMIGVRKRYQSIKVKYQTLELQTRIKTYTGWTAQIIQHEVDHCDGALVRNRGVYQTARNDGQKQQRGAIGIEPATSRSQTAA